MSEPSQYSYNVLSGLFSNKIVGLRTRVKSNYFSESGMIQLYAFCVQFYAKNKIVPTLQVVEDAFKNELWDLQQEVKAIVAKLNLEIDDALFEHSVNQFLEHYKIEQITLLSRKVANIESTGYQKVLEDLKKTLTVVNNVDNSKLKELNTKNTDDIESFISRETAPLEEGEAGVAVRNPIINRITAGMKPKRFWLVVGSPGECKSTQLMNFAYDALVSNMNIFYCTVEMDLDQVFRIMACIHAYRKYNVIIDARKAESKQLVGEELKTYLDAIRDLGQYKANLDVFELPSTYSFSNFESKLIEANSNKRIDAVFLDYLLLLRSDSKRNQKHEEHEELFQNAKQLCNGFDGRGVFFCTAHQVNTEGLKRAKKRGFYVMEDLAKTAAARESPDFVIANYLDDTLRTQNELRQSLIKNRGGEFQVEPWICSVQLECGIINPPLDMDDIPKDLKL